MVRFRGKPCPGPPSGRGRESRPTAAASAPAGGCGVKDQVSRAGARLRTRARREVATGASDGRLEFAFKGRGLRVNEEIRETARRKLSRLARMEPRATVVDLEVIANRNPRLTPFRVEGELRRPRRSFRASGEGPDVATALDQLARRLERQVRDDHSRRRARPSGRGNGLESAHA
jgi:ribosomal subunit interface protein